MKIYVISSILLLQVANCFSGRVLIDLQPEGLQARRNDKSQSVDFGTGDDIIFSKHIPAVIKSLELTSGELKQFAGHAIQLVKAKCPAVPTKNLNDINKYIGKLISTTNPVQSTSPVADKVISAVTTCAKNTVTNPNAKIYSNGADFWTNFMSPYRRMWESKQTGEDESDDGETVTNSSDSDSMIVTVPAQVGYYVPDVDTVVYTEDDGTSSTWAPFQWIGNVFASLRGFFSRLFGGSSFSRKKRAAVSVGGEKASPIDDIIDKLATTPMSGRNAFIYFFDNVCRLYCSNCDKEQTMNFKAAVKDLLLFILKDTTGSDLAAQEFLDNAFLQTMNDC